MLLCGGVVWRGVVQFRFVRFRYSSGCEWCGDGVCVCVSLLLHASLYRTCAAVVQKTQILSHNLHRALFFGTIRRGREGWKTIQWVYRKSVCSPILLFIFVFACLVQVQCVCSVVFVDAWWYFVVSRLLTFNPRGVCSLLIGLDVSRVYVEVAACLVLAALAIRG